MKLKCLILFFFLLTTLILSCSLEKTKDNGKENKRNLEKERNNDNEVINQIATPLLDSLKHIINLNIETDLSKLSCIYYVDSLFDPRFDYSEVKSMFFENGITIDTLLLNKGKCKLILNGFNNVRGTRFCSISRREDISRIANLNSNRFVLLGFTRIGFNKNQTEGCFNVDLVCSLNAGLGYLVLVIKKNDKWFIKKIVESSIR